MDDRRSLPQLCCLDCDATVAPTTGDRVCPECGGDVAPQSSERNRDDDSTLPAVADLLAHDPDPTGLGVGTTPLIDCPGLAAELDVARLSVKREGQNPTGSVRDRELAVAAAVADASDAPGVTLPTTGPAGVAAAAFASRHGLDVSAFVPSRAAFDAKALVNVYGGDMTVVEGGYADAVAAFEAERPGDFAAVDPGNPWRLAGGIALATELVLTDGATPDVVLTPGAHGTLVTGLRLGFDRVRAAGLGETLPRLVVAESAGCAPLSTAQESADGTGENTIVPSVDGADTVLDGLAVAEPVCGDIALAALRATDGRAVAVEDDRGLSRAVDLAQTDGVACSGPGGVALAAATELADRGALAADEQVVIIDPAQPDADLLRSHLMSRGV